MRVDYALRYVFRYKWRLSCCKYCDEEGPCTILGEEDLIYLSPNAKCYKLAYNRGCECLSSCISESPFSIRKILDKSMAVGDRQINVVL
jgi:hypothetical protein